MKHIATATAFVASLAACAGPDHYHVTPQDAAQMSTMDLCTKLKKSQYLRETSTDPLRYSPASSMVKDSPENILAELGNRGFTQREVNSISQNIVFIGMSREAAQCAWLPTKVNKSIGEQYYSEQWVSGYQYFYVDETGKVTAIQG